MEHLSARENCIWRCRDSAGDAGGFVMKARKIRSTLLALAGVAALSFPAWGPVGGSTLLGAADPTCEPPGSIEACLPEFTLPPDNVLPSDLPTPTESPTPTEPPTPSPSPSEEPLPGAAPGLCVRVGYPGAACTFTLTGEHVIVGGLSLEPELPIALPSGGPSIDPSTLPSFGPSDIPEIDPSSLPTVDPSILPSIDPSLIPSLAPNAARRSAAVSSFNVELVIRDPLTLAETVLARCSGEGACLEVATLEDIEPGITVTCILRGASNVSAFGCGSYE